jgi:hypothetical protein
MDPLRIVRRCMISQCVESSLQNWSVKGQELIENLRVPFGNDGSFLIFFQPYFHVQTALKLTIIIYSMTLVTNSCFILRILDFIETNIHCLCISNEWMNE